LEPFTFGSSSALEGSQQPVSAHGRHLPVVVISPGGLATADGAGRGDHPDLSSSALEGSQL